MMLFQPIKSNHPCQLTAKEEISPKSRSNDATSALYLTATANHHVVCSSGDLIIKFMLKTDIVQQGAPAVRYVKNVCAVFNTRDVLFTYIFPMSRKRKFA